MNTTQKPTGISYKLRSFTTEEIESILEQSRNFRDVSQTLVNKYYSSMINGSWSWANGEVLIFDSNERLLNGQHRLTAAARFQKETGHVCWWWCAFGADPSTGVAMDLGRGRNLTAYMRHEKVPYYCSVATIVSGDVRVKNTPGRSLNVLAHGVVTVHDQKTKESIAVSADIASCIDVYRRNRKEVEYWAACSEKARHAGFPRRNLLCSIGYQLAKRDGLNAKLFFSYLFEGTNLKADDPILLLRNKLIEDRSTKRRLDPTTFVAFVIKAWTTWLRGNQMRSLRWIAVGPSAEEFPNHIVPKEEVAV